MELRSASDNTKKSVETCCSKALPMPILPVVVDDQSPVTSADEDSNSQTRNLNFGITDDDQSSSSNKRKILSIRDPKSHRMIEKRRRDRMNNCLSDLLRLIPQEKNDGQRRVEKAEIIEMATKHIRQMTSASAQKSKIPADDGISASKSSFSTELDLYRSGYQDSLDDACDYVQTQMTNDLHRSDLLQHFKRKKVELSDMTTLSRKKRRNSSSASNEHLSFKRETSDVTNTKKQNSFSATDDDDDSCRLFDTTQVYSQNALQLSTNNPKEQTQSPKTPFSNAVTATAPIFVLHPSGTHYIPMCIDASIVSHAFENNHASSSGTGDALRCHPVSIPVNFHPITALSDPYELDIQNINVIGTRLQTSVRPN